MASRRLARALVVLGLAGALAVARAGAPALDAASLEGEVSSPDTVVLVAFKAPWCGHCKALTPKFDAAADSTAAPPPPWSAATRDGSPPRARVVLATVDADAHPDLAARYGVHSYPTLLVFSGSTDPARVREYRGARSAGGLAAWAARAAEPTPFADLAALAAAADAAGAPPFDLHAWAAREGGDGVAFVLVFPLVNAPAAALVLSEGVRAAAAGLRYGVVFATASDDAARGLPGVARHLFPPGAPEPCAPGLPCLLRVEAGVAAVDALTPAALAAGGPAALARAMKSAARGDPLWGFAPGSTAAAVAAWVVRGATPLVTPLGPDNFGLAAHNAEGRLLAVAALDEADATHADGNASRASAAMLAALRALAAPATSPLPPRVRERFRFGWLDAGTFRGFVKQFGIAPEDAPRLFVLNAPAKAFWYDPSVDEIDEMVTWLSDVAAGVAPMQRQGLLALPQRVLNTVGAPAAAAVGAAAAAAALYAVWTLVVAEALGFNDAARARRAEAAAAERARKTN